MSKKLKIGVVVFNEMMENYNGTLLERNGNVMHILIDNREYYYGIPSQQIREKGDPNWTVNVKELLSKNKV